MSIEREGRCRQNGRDANFKYVGCHVRRDVTEASRASLKMAAWRNKRRRLKEEEEEKKRWRMALADASMDVSVEASPDGTHKSKIKRRR